MKIVLPLFIILIILKILGLIQLGWFWVVTSIIWIPLIILFAEMFLLGFLVAAYFAVLAWFTRD